MREKLTMDKIPIAGPWITQKEIKYVADAAKNAWYSNTNMYNDRFEKSFSRYVGRRFAITLPSCTSAIHLSLLSLNIGSGDEVIVPEITWIATAAPINYVGAKPVFADIDEKTWCMSAESFEKRITKNTKAVILVDLYGNMPDMDRINVAARKHRIHIIEDAAEAVGSEYKKRKAGSFGTTSTFSFHGSKTLTTGEGGMLVTDDENIYRRSLILRDHGRLPGDSMFFNVEVAYKYRMSDLQAALGLAQLERIDDLIEQKRRIFAWYLSELADVDGITLNYEAPNTKNNYWMVTVIIDKKFGFRKEDLISRMAKNGIDCRPFFHPLSSLPAYRYLKLSSLIKKGNPNSYRISPYGINLPSSLNLTKEKVKYVCNILKRILKHNT